MNIEAKSIINTVIAIYLFLINEGKIIAKEKHTPLSACPRSFL